MTFSSSRIFETEGPIRSNKSMASTCNLYSADILGTKYLRRYLQASSAMDLRYLISGLATFWNKKYWKCLNCCDTLLLSSRAEEAGNRPTGREELIALVRELQRQNAQLREEIERLKRWQRRQAAPFSKQQRVQNPRSPARRARPISPSRGSHQPGQNGGRRGTGLLPVLWRSPGTRGSQLRARRTYPRSRNRK